MNKLSENRRTILVILRITIGALMLWAGLDKFLDPEGFSAAGYLNNATQGPFVEIFQSMAGNSFVDFLVVFGQIGIGLSMIFGVVTRFSSMCGSLMMFLFYLSILPPEHGFISEHIIYILVFVLLGIFGAGRYFGVDKYLEEKEFVKKNFRVLRWFLG